MCNSQNSWVQSIEALCVLSSADYSMKSNDVKHLVCILAYDPKCESIGVLLAGIPRWSFEVVHDKADAFMHWLHKINIGSTCLTQTQVVFLVSRVAKCWFSIWSSVGYARCRSSVDVLANKRNDDVSCNWGERLIVGTVLRVADMLNVLKALPNNATIQSVEDVDQIRIGVWAFLVRTLVLTGGTIEVLSSLVGSGLKASSHFLGVTM